jgi:hypothetical protein
MSNSPDKKSMATSSPGGLNWSAIGALAGIASVLITVIIWIYPRDHWPGVSRAERTGAEQTPETSSPLVPTPPPPGDIASGIAGEEDPLVPLGSPPAGTGNKHGVAEMLSEFELADGEQKVVLAGRASVAVEFNRQGQIDFVTVRVGTGGESVPKAVLGAGERIEFHLGGRTYYVSVLRIDRVQKTVALRID